MTRATEREIACDVKGKWCYIALEGCTDRKSTVKFSDEKKTYEIPVGIIITVSSVRTFSIVSKSCSGQAPPARKPSGIHNTSFPAHH